MRTQICQDFCRNIEYVVSMKHLSPRRTVDHLTRPSLMIVMHTLDIQPKIKQLET